MGFPLCPCHCATQFRCFSNSASCFFKEAQQSSSCSCLSFLLWRISVILNMRFLTLLSQPGMIASNALLATLNDCGSASASYSQPTHEGRVVRPRWFAWLHGLVMRP